MIIALTPRNRQWIPARHPRGGHYSSPGDTQNLVMLHDNGSITEITVEADGSTDCPVVHITSDRKRPVIVIVNGIKTEVRMREQGSGHGTAEIQNPD